MSDDKTNRGEGDRQADRAYRRDAAKFIAGHDVEKRSEQAGMVLARDPESFKAAEAKGRAKAQR